MLKIDISSLVVFLAIASSAQTHFSSVKNTGNNMTVLVQAAINPSIDGQPLSNGDEIAVFTPSELCVGAIAWQGNNTAITVWGDDDQTAAIDGIKGGEVLSFKVWDASRNLELPARVSFQSGGPSYSADGIAILDSLKAASPTSVFLSSNPVYYPGKVNYRSKMGSQKANAFNILGKRVYKNSSITYIFKFESGVIEKQSRHLTNRIISN